MEKIKIVLAKAHEGQMENPDIQQEVVDVQQFFDENDFPFQEGAVHFVILRGSYEPIDKSMNVAGVFVNHSGSPIKALKGSLHIELKEDKEAAFPKMDFQFPPEFLGEIKHKEGFIIHVKVPAENVPEEKRVYQATELAGRIDDIQVIQ